MCARFAKAKQNANMLAVALALLLGCANYLAGCSHVDYYSLGSFGNIVAITDRHVPMVEPAQRFVILVLPDGKTYYVHFDTEAPTTIQTTVERVVTPAADASKLMTGPFSVVVPTK